ncbi:MAG: hypothetical protein OES99_10235, partial [Gammaproteobacteria bacterium]|nr:hypothetical protein [Gammaproteobacteria bacterium]
MLISRLQANLGPAAIQYRWPIIIVMLLIAAAIGSGVSRLSFTTDLRVFFSERNPQLQALETLENVYTKDENILFILAPSDGKVFTRQTLTAVDELTAASWKLPFASRVDSVTNFQHTFARADELIVEDLVPDTSALSNEELARVSDIALAEPLLVNRLVSPTGHVTAVNVNLLIPGASVEEVPTAAMAGRELAAQIRERYPEIDLYVDGGVMMDYAFGEAGQRDMKTLAPIMFIVLIAITGLALRSLSATFATMMVIT